MKNIKVATLTIAVLIAPVISNPAMANDDVAEKKPKETAIAYQGYNYGQSYVRISDRVQIAAAITPNGTSGYNYAREYHQLSHDRTDTQK